MRGGKRWKFMRIKRKGWKIIESGCLHGDVVALL